MARRRRQGEILRFLRESVWKRQYVFTRHAKLEMRDDGLRPRDIRRVLLVGDLVRTFTRDPRGSRHLMRGVTVSGMTVEVVWRRVLDYVRIITVFVVE